MTYQNILIDVDDTIFDFPAAEEKAFRALLKALKIDYTPQLHQKYTDFNQHLWAKIDQGKLTRDEMQKSRFKDFFQKECGVTVKDNDHLLKMYHQAMASSHVFKIHAQQCIKQLKKEGYHLAIISNGLEAVQKKRLTEGQVLDDFDQLFISQKMGVMKPTKAYFDQVFKLSGWQPQQSIVIGDDLLSDITGAEQYGLASIWYNQRHLMNMTDIHPTFVCDDWAAIPALLK